jgi:ABC-2 type transport system permease protein
VAASFMAELLKLRKRPATWILAAVLAVGVILLGYVLPYVFFSMQPEESAPPGLNTEALTATLLPERLLQTILSQVSGIGGPVALILGALAMGSEYGWGTLKTALTQRPGRLSIFFGKLLGLAPILVAFILVASAAGALGSYGVALIEDAPVDWPSLGETARGIAAAGLIMAVWTLFGVFLATLFSSTAFGIGLGLVYSLVVEGVARSLPVESEAYETFREFLLGENSSSLAALFGTPNEAFGVPPPLVQSEQAAWVLGAYALGFTLLAAFFVRRRDVM